MEIERAIRERLVLELRYHEDSEPEEPGTRLVEPYVLYSDHRGRQMLRVWQVDGFSIRGNLPDWRTFHTDSLSEVEVLRTHFIPRPDRQAMLQGLDMAATIASIET